ncbi:thiamine pyrophosphate-binding protein [Herbiconiux moechotypicola]|uniref:thiamine pyrophosphate-binding protein n=1 Tax=Herbiconiux moechotypicola TaxID=637393 RepID=UPI00217EBC83|nr:thiamine pyrophosphate-binding protein [Herbiconiux moechotypicola]MCS5729997.1 thiamine pyrophosphate-binding protein [Herbiconiux moechotypicola]
MNDERRTTGTAMIQALERNGVELVLGIPGTHNIELYRGLERSTTIRHVLTKHEQGAAYAADGYARATGRPGVVVTTSGPGLTNALTGMANAYADSVPMLVISPAIPTGQERSDIGWLHEMKDQRAAVDNIATRSVRAGTPAAAVDAVHEAFARWAVERPRPVHIEVPLDVLEAEWDPSQDALLAPWRTPSPAAPAPEAVARTAELVEASPLVVIVAGGGAVGASESLTLLAERLAAPVVTTTLGKGVLDERHPLCVGEFATNTAVSSLLERADLVLAIGTEIAVPEVWGGVTTPRVRVDIDPAQLHKNIRADVAVHADADLFARALLGAVEAREHTGRVELVAEVRAEILEGMEAAIGRWRAIQDELSAALPADTIVTGDSSQVSYLGTGPFWRFAEPRHYLVTTGFSTLGYSLPAAIGAKLAFPEAPVVCLVGDGAFLFSAQEVLTARELGLPLPIVVVDNAGFAEIRQNMTDAGMPPLAVDYAPLGMEAFAHAVGVAFRSVDGVGELAAAVADALTAPGPTLLHLQIT